MKNTLALLAFLIMMGCQANNEKTEQPTASDMENDLSKCDTKIEPYFEGKDTNVVKRYSFERFTAHTIEKATFENGVQLELQQSGCRVGKQRYQFILPTKIEENDNASFWVEIAAKQFEYMLQTTTPGSGSENVFMFVNGFLTQFKNDIPLGKQISPADDASLKVDKFVNPNQTMILVELEFQG